MLQSRAALRFSLRMFSVLASTATLLATSQTFARETRYKDYPLEINAGDRLSVSLLKGSVKLTPVAQGKPAVLRVKKTLKDQGVTPEDIQKYDQMIFAVRREGTTLMVEMKGPDSKAAYLEWMKAGSPEMQLEIEAPSIPAEIAVREGSVNIQDWKESVRANVVVGSVKTSSTEGELAVSAQRGDVKVEKHQGHFEADSYSAKVAVVGSEGDVTLANYSGESNISGVKGAIEARSHAGSTVVAKSSGSVEFQSGRGATNVSDFEGPIKGETDLGNVTLAVAGEADVNVESNQGNVVVKLPSGSGAALQLATEEGSIALPESTRSPASAQKTVRMRLMGDGPRGTVAVKSKASSIRIRE